MSEYAMADVFSEEETGTDSFVRFRTVTGSRGFPDTTCDPRGFAVKFHTKEATGTRPALLKFSISDDSQGRAEQTV